MMLEERRRESWDKHLHSSEQKAYEYRSGSSDRRRWTRGRGGVGGVFGIQGKKSHMVAFKGKFCICMPDREIRAGSPATGPLSIDDFHKILHDFL